MHSLWTDEVASNISEELEGAKCIICSEKLCGIVEETTEIQDMNEEELLVDEIREWLEKIRQTGYVFLSWTTCGRTACHFIISRSKENKAADRDNAMQNTPTTHNTPTLLFYYKTRKAAITTIVIIILRIPIILCKRPLEQVMSPLAAAIHH